MSRDRPSLGTAETSRRRFLRGVASLSLGAASMGALVACRQPAARPASKRLPLIGYFSLNSEKADSALEAELRDGLDALGYRDQKTIQMEWRHVDFGNPNRWSDSARELVALRPDVIVARSFPAVPALHSVTQTIPIVVVLPGSSTEDLIGAGLITNQARPGGNITGLVGSTPTLAGKRLDLLHEILPQATRLAILKGDATQDIYKPFPAWTSHAISLRVLRQDELDDAFVRFDDEHAELLAVDERGLIGFLDQIGAQVRRRRLPATSGLDAFAASGGLMSYAADATALFRGAGRFIDKILRGASPADLPIELPTTFRFIINKAAANELGLSIPPAVLAQATEVLQ